MRPDDKLLFDKAAEVLGLDLETRDQSWLRMSKLGITPSDPTSIFIVTSGVLDKVASLVTASNDALPERIERAASKAVGPIARAAAQQAAADLHHMAADAADTLTASVKAGIAEASTVQRSKLGALVIGIGAAIALATGIVGYSLGRSNVSGLATEYGAIVSRADAGTWLGLMQMNPDLNASLRACGPGSARARSVEGARYCEVPLWLDASRPPALAGASSVYVGLMDWLAGWGPLWLLGGGLLAGLLGRKILRATVSWRPIKWLVD